MVNRLLIPLCCTGALALACGPRSHTDAIATASYSMSSEEHSRAERDASRAAARARRAKRDGKLVSSLSVDAKASPVRFVLAIENAGNKTIEMHFPNGQTHDIAVLDAAGREVWRWADGRMFTQALRTRPISGGDTLQLEETWDAEAHHGTFTAVATLRSTNFPIEERATFKLP